MAEENPWQTLSSETKYDNPWIEVTEHQVLTPAGNPGIYGTVHFKNLAVGVLAIGEEGQTWLVGQYRYPLERYTWEIPEGGGEHGADPLTSAQRELKEETGIEAREWHELLEMELSNSITDERAIVYLATGLSFGEPEPEDTEVLVTKKVHFSELYAMVLDARITDVMTVAAVLKARLLWDELSLPDPGQSAPPA